MCLIVRDQREYILEWVEHYLKLGVGRIYLYDHGSDPALIPSVAHLVEEGVVEYHWMSRIMHKVRRAVRLRYEQCDFYCELCDCGCTVWVLEKRLSYRTMAFFMVFSLPWCVLVCRGLEWLLRLVLVLL